MTSNDCLRREFLAAVTLLLPLLSFAADQPPSAQNNPIWLKLRVHLFQDRPINENGAKLIELSAPARAEDAAVVPVAIRTLVAQTSERYIKTIHLILDNNPGPVAAVFHMTPESGRADIETRVRVEQYTHLRAVVEMNDGALSMSTVYLKASGGCSVPIGKESSEPAISLGKIKLAADDHPKLNQTVMAQLMIRHPNLSGLAMNQLTRLYDSPHFVRKVEVAYAGKPVMTADLDFSISENPHFRFYFTPKAEGLLTAQVQDSHDLSFSTALKISPQ
ncbi:quinoprotein dehydrogenase-associated SoxYZ-like carrier [Polaromonas sp.]|uniref:quinoprotein dehydrogenase-associated SoxYZ-like carrier n=1 Tax=Polaromonas sp. TaxID=1869339 RepID=UPI0017B5530A|nr:quinoprotein dehydrogenase-associated SoxYZ-like carrier [Polaromonas sp.]NMM04732.1 quinoprotein dehydrogenase-associated SoxYZ-like carrier [Polaromonas sp.]